MTFADLNLWNLISTEVAFLLFVVMVALGVLFIFAVSALGLPFWGLSEALHPRHQDALRRGQMKRARRLEIAQNSLDQVGDFVVGFGFLGLVGGGIIAVWGVRFLAVGVAALLVLAALGAIATRLGLIDPA
jgi:hypothetical protein